MADPNRSTPRVNVLPAFTPLATGLSYSIMPNGHVLIDVDPTGTGSPSASGKTTVKATTHGNVPLPGVPGHKIGINCYKE
jgi:hypothetical protein